MSETAAPYGTGPAASTSPGPVRRVRVHHLREMKERGEKFAMLTAYEMYAAQTFDEAGIPVLLVGDSASNNVYGNETSLPVTVDELIPLVRAVTRSVRRALVVADLPFGSYQGSPEQAFHTGVRVSPSSLTLDDEVRRYEYKAGAGAEFAITEPVFDVADIEHFVARTRGVALPLVVAVRTLGSLREAEWLANEVPGQRVPQALVERMRRAAAEGTEAAEGVAIAQETVEAIKPGR